MTRQHAVLVSICLVSRRGECSAVLSRHYTGGKIQWHTSWSIFLSIVHIYGYFITYVTTPNWNLFAWKHISMTSVTCPLVWQEGVKRGSGQRRECQCSHSKATLASAGTISTYIMDRGAPAPAWEQREHRHCHPVSCLQPGCEQGNVKFIHFITSIFGPS